MPLQRTNKHASACKPGDIKRHSAIHALTNPDGRITSIEEQCQFSTSAAIASIGELSKVKALALRASHIQTSILASPPASRLVVPRLLATAGSSRSERRSRSPSASEPPVWAASPSSMPPRLPPTRDAAPRSNQGAIFGSISSSDQTVCPHGYQTQQCPPCQGRTRA